MGVPALILKDIMLEEEFLAHRIQMRVDPDPLERILHMLRLNVPATMALANAWGGKFRATAESFDPWEHQKKLRAMGADGAKWRIEQMAMTAFGFPAGVIG